MTSKEPKEERIRKTFKFPAKLVEEIEKYQREKFISTFSGAVYELIRRGLEAEKERRK